MPKPFTFTGQHYSVTAYDRPPDISTGVSVSQSPGKDCFAVVHIRTVAPRFVIDDGVE